MTEPEDTQSADSNHDTFGHEVSSEGDDPRAQSESDDLASDSQKQIDSQGGIIDDLTWLGRGFVQPLYDVRFYRAAARKSLIDAVLFFVVFGTLLSIVSTFSLTRSLRSVSEDIEQAFASGEFPEITIENGRATVRARQPLILLEGEGAIIILDTSGVYQGIDTGRYSQGFLLTRNSLHAYSEGDYQIFQLSDFNSAFGNPIEINRETALEFWRSFTSIFSVVAFIGIGLWNLLVRFIWLSFLSVLVWGLLSAFNIRSEFGSVLAVGIYALVPAVYITYLLGLVGISFCGFQTGLLLVIWVVVARMALKPDEPTGVGYTTRSP